MKIQKYTQSLFYLTKKVRKLSVQLLLIASLSSLSTLSLATDINNDNASVAFAGEHAGMKFSGLFEKWEGTIVLPPDDNAGIDVTFYLSSAKTGDFTYDTTLPEGDWFDTNNHPEGNFLSSNLRLENNKLYVEGMLTLKGKTKNEVFEFTQNDDVWVATFPIDRLEYEIGLESDPDAEWVSRDIIMTITIPYTDPM